MQPLFRFIEVLIFPPGIYLLIGIFGLYVVKRRGRVGRFLLVISLGFIWFFSTPLVSFILLDGLQEKYPPLMEVPPQADVIVVLGAGREEVADEFGAEENLTPHGVVRIRYAAYLAKKTGLPVIAAGGKPFGGSRSEGDIMSEVLKNEFGVEHVIVEGDSTTTFENAAMTKEVMNAHGLKTPVIVTEYSHMPRSMLSFNRNGMNAIAAPTGRDTPAFTEKGVWVVLPQGKSLERTQRALHEWFGRVWYKLKF